jgi:hypothetical protein
MLTSDKLNLGNYKTKKNKCGRKCFRQPIKKQQFKTVIDVWDTTEQEAALDLDTFYL